MTLGEGTLGSGTLGNPGTSTSLNLKHKRIDADKVHLMWDAQPAAVGYRFYRNGKAVSATFDGTRNSANMSAVAGDKVSVVAISELMNQTITT